MDKMRAEEHYSHGDYEIWAYMDDDYPADVSHYFYKITEKGGMQDYWLRDPVIRESSEWFDTEQEARFAAIWHIDLLENGEGIC
jgi:hypothetical protein